MAIRLLSTEAFILNMRTRMPFRYGMCREGGAWHAYELRDGGRRVVN